MERNRLKLIISGFLQACVTSRLGWVLVVVHALWFYLGIRSMGPSSRAAANFLDSFEGADWTLFAGRPFHYHYEPWIMKALIWADMPSMLVQAACGLLLWPVSTRVHIGTYEGSYVLAVFLFLIASLQWLIIGHLLEKRFWKRLG